MNPQRSSDAATRQVVYPDSDGEPMADNTEQFDWITFLKFNLDRALPGAFVAGDLLWYPVEGDPTTRAAPDVLVALGRPKGRRGSYRTWDEGGVVPQVVFEIWYPGHRWPKMAEKLMFYDRFGVSEFYIYDPDENTLDVYFRGANGLQPVGFDTALVSPLLGVRFELGEDLKVFHADGTRFQSYDEVADSAEAERQRAEAERDRAEAERQRADAATARAAELEAKLRALGLEP